MIITLDQVAIFFLILSRLAGLMVRAPFFSSKQMFTFGKMAFVIWLSGLMIFVVPITPNIPQTPLTFILAILVEFLIGIILGFVADIMVAGIELAGALMDTQAGLSVASLLDPSTGQNAALFQQLLKWISILIFIVIDGHHMVLSAVYQSFILLPAGTPIKLQTSMTFLAGMGKDIFLIGVQLAAPILLIVFLVDFSFGMLNRVAEQINVFQLGFQVKPLVSLTIFLAISPGLVYVITNLMEQIMEKLLEVMTHLQPV